MQTHASRLHGRTALVTGGASGIGLATARTLVGLGVHTIVMDVEPPPPDLDAVFAAADVRRPEEWDRVLAGPVAARGGLDLALLNAGVQSPTGDLDALSDDDYRRVVGVNLDGVVLGARAVARAMDARGGGAIVMTASLAGLVAYAPDPLYAATKHGVVGFARAVAPQLAARGITVNVVCPGLTDTAFLTEEQHADVDRAAFPLIPVQGIADAIVARFAEDETGGVWVCQFGRPPIRYEARGVPGPAGGATPPAGLSQVTPRG
jgi:NAD(P)-dependent dehydrogenase (short-subunit alcohol dehydrogenase family)